MSNLTISEPHVAAGCREDNRINRIKQVIALVLAAAALLTSTTAHALPPRADTPGTASISIVPLDLKPRGVVLQGQTVDAVIEEDAAGALWADTRVWLKLHNAGKAAVVLPIALPGPQWGVFDLPEGLAVQLDDRPLALARAALPQGQAGITLTTPITIPAKGDVTLRVSFRQALAERAGLVDYAYILTSTRVWAGTPESLRVTAQFKPPLATDQLLSSTPTITKVTPASYTWEWTGAKATSNTALAFLSPAAWRELSALRTAAAALDAPLAARRALADRYWQLANLTPPAYSEAGAYYDRFWPMVIGELRAGVAAPGTAAPTELAAVHARLADLYRGQAERTPESAEAYLQLAASEFRAAVALDGGHAEHRTAALALEEQLAQAAQARGDALSAQAHRAQVAALRGEQGVASAEALSQTEALTLAVDALDAGNLPLARQLAKQAYGPLALVAPGAAAPRIDQATATISASPKERVIALKMVDRTQGTDETALAGAVARAWRGSARVETSEGGLTVTLSYSGTADLKAQQAQLLSALPTDPELALLRVVLASSDVRWEDAEARFSTERRYVERVDLRAAAQAWEAEALKLEAAAMNPQRPDPRLDRVAAAAWIADAGAWRALGAHSRAIYRVSLYEQGAGPLWLTKRVRQIYTERTVAREWVAPVGAERELSAAVTSWRYDRLGAALVAALAVILLVALLVWRVVR